jgi:RNA-directed DNA polymerase
VGFKSKKRRVRITGLVINCGNDISVGRNEKRKLKALIHRFKLARLDVQNTSYLKGYLAYVNSVEPKFVNALEIKYGKEVLDAILNTQTVQLKT